MVHDSGSLLAMRRIYAVVTLTIVSTALTMLNELPVSAGYVHASSTVACDGGVSGTAFGGTCFALEAPSQPTQPSLWHSWLTSPPSAPAACSPYETTEWAPASAGSSGGVVGEVYTLEDQRVPIVVSTPITDWGWVFSVTCGSPGAVRFLSVVSGPRTPSPCSAQTTAANCLPGLNPSTFLAAVSGQVPPETIVATPPGPGIVGVPVEAELSPAPIPKYAEVNLAVPDLGDGDSGESLHVVWVVAATPEIVWWTWPDGTATSNSEWIPQTYDDGGLIRARLVYNVTATGFWSDGVTVHDLPSVSVGTIPVVAQLGYSVQQIQPGLG